MPIIDLLLFAAGAAMAWFGRWQAGDLVWGLWLPSLVVGYSLRLTGIFTPVLRGDPSGEAWAGTGRPIERSVRRPQPWGVSQLLLPARQPPAIGGPARPGRVRPGCRRLHPDDELSERSPHAPAHLLLRLRQGGPP